MGIRVNKIAVIGNYIPRKCGIATFTTDLCESLAGRYSDASVIALPMTDIKEGYDYPDRAVFEIPDASQPSYRSAAEFLRVENVDVVSVQHEYGIFGGDDGKYILSLLSDLHVPIVTTLHTVLREPSEGQRQVLMELARLSDRLVVMSGRAVQFLQDIYNVPTEKIDFIHHGIPDVPFVDPNFHKDKFGVEGQTVLLTFGLLSPNKGIEYVIQALPKILHQFPNVVYVVLGATHPAMLRNEGEGYRESLQTLARELGVEEHVKFHNRFVTLEELCEYIGSADIYITPYLTETQITSGTLAYSTGAGKAVISTPYWYAQELLAEGRGVLVPFRNAEAIAENVHYLLENEAERHAMRKKAYALGREMIWPRVAEEYMTSFTRAIEGRIVQPRVSYRGKIFSGNPADYPALRLDHLFRLTDNVGLLQHARFNVPNYDEGYTTDDNARALIFTTRLTDQETTALAEARRLETRYLAFLNAAYNPAIRRFRNFMSYSRTWLEEVGSEDSHGRSLWALGTVAGRSRDQGKRDLAADLFESALEFVETFSSPRAWAFTLCGIHEYLCRYPGHRAVKRRGIALAGELLRLYKENAEPDWRWFEDRLTYANAKLPHALLLMGEYLGRNDLLEAGFASLQWLIGQQRLEGDHFVPIGSEGFYARDGRRARFDQQPIEAHSTVSTCLEAFRLTHDEHWRTEAQRAFEWFLGRNDLGVSLYDPTTGGCYDGLHPSRLNRNQGAESTLAFLLSLIEMQHAMKMAYVQPVETTTGALAWTRTMEKNREEHAPTGSLRLISRS